MPLKKTKAAKVADGDSDDDTGQVNEMGLPVESETSCLTIDEVHMTLLDFNKSGQWSKTKKGQKMKVTALKREFMVGLRHQCGCTHQNPSQTSVCQSSGTLLCYLWLWSGFSP